MAPIVSNEKPHLRCGNLFSVVIEQETSKLECIQHVDKAQIMEFKDAFSIMDTNGDGIVDINDLKVTFERLGQPATTQEIEAMLGDATGPINFTVFLTLMADKLANTDPENTILKAFSAFDDNRNGKINAAYLRECMTTMGDRFTDEEVDIMFKGNVIDEDGNFNYRDFVRILKTWRVTNQSFSSLSNNCK